jgi:hypothetical protein
MLQQEEERDGGSAPRIRICNIRTMWSIPIIITIIIIFFFCSPQAIKQKTHHHQKKRHKSLMQNSLELRKQQQQQHLSGKWKMLQHHPPKATFFVALFFFFFSCLEFLQAASDPRLGLGFLDGRGVGSGGAAAASRCMQVDELVLLVRQLWVARVMVDAHALAVGRRCFANRACQFRMSAFVHSLAIR